MLALTTVKKLMRESFATTDHDTREITSVKLGSRLAWFDNLVDILNRLDRVQCSLWPNKNTTEEDCSVDILITGVSDKRNPDDRFGLEFKTQFDVIDGLWITDESRRKHGTETPAVGVYGLEQVEQFVATVKDRQESNHLRDCRKQKVASLQQTGLTSRLKELGAEHDFAFAMSENARDVKLSIRIGGRKRGFHFSFPKGKLASVLEQVPDLINTLENMQSLGVNFRSENKLLKMSQGEWIEPPAKPKVKNPKMKSKTAVNNR